MCHAERGGRKAPPENKTRYSERSTPHEKPDFIGDEYKIAREVLIKLLPGNSAWRQVA